MQPAEMALVCSNMPWQTKPRCDMRCRDPGSNRGPSDLQSDALPTELKRLSTLVFQKLKKLFYYNWNSPGTKSDPPVLVFKNCKKLNCDSFWIETQFAKSLINIKRFFQFFKKQQLRGGLAQLEERVVRNDEAPVQISNSPGGSCRNWNCKTFAKQSFNSEGKSFSPSVIKCDSFWIETQFAKSLINNKTKSEKNEKQSVGQTVV